MTRFGIGEIRLDDGGDGRDLYCDIETLLDTRLLIQSNSGGGKSRTIRRMLEQTHRYVPQMVIDYEGDFATLREKYDYVLAAPKGGDVVAHPRTAALLAERLLELRVSGIIDIYELLPPDRILFVRNFLEAVINSPKSAWHPWIIVVDEVHAFAPEKGHGTAVSSDAVAALASLGRKRGFCGWFATQRIGKLSKDVAAECNNVLVGRTRLDIDVKRAAEDLGFDKARSRELKKLQPGEFYASGPAFGADEAVRVMVGDVQTTHPKAGKRLQVHVPPPSAKVKAALAQLSDLPAEAEERAKTVEDLRAQVTRLERELREAKKAQPAAPPAPKPERIEVPAITKNARQHLERAIESAGNLAVRINDGGKGLFDLAEKLSVAVSEIHIARTTLADQLARATAPAPLPRKLHEMPRNAVPRPAPRPPTSTPKPARAAAAGDHRLTPGELKILTAIAQHQEYGTTSEQLSVLTTYKRSSRDTYLQKLRAAGLIVTHGDDHFATDAGLAALGDDFEPLPTGAALREHWLETLTGGERWIFGEVLDAYPGAIEREQLGAGGEKYKRSSRDTYLQKLIARRLVEAVGRGAVRASDVLFGGGG